MHEKRATTQIACKMITLTRRKALAYTRSYTGWSGGDFRGLVINEKDISAESAPQTKAAWFYEEDVNTGRSSRSEEQTIEREKASHCVTSIM
jgi:hypothetical protein